MCRAPLHLSTAALLTAALAGCGGTGTESAPMATPSALTGTERRLVRNYDARIQEHCERVTRSLTDPDATPSPAQERLAFQAADALGALAARKPTAEIDAGQDLRLFLSDTIENLDGSNCDPRMRARLEEALRAIPIE